MLVNVGKYLDGASKVKLKVFEGISEVSGLAFGFEYGDYALRQTNTYITYWKLHSLTHSLTLSLSLSLSPSLSFCLYLHMYIYICVCVHACVICICIYIYIYIYICARVSVHVERLNRLKTSRAAYIIINILSQGITGVPGGSVINEDTSPGPV